MKQTVVRLRKLLLRIIRHKTMLSFPIWKKPKPRPSDLLN